MPDTEKIHSTPYAPLGIIALPGTEELAAAIDKNIVRWRRERESEYKNNYSFDGYERDTYIINTEMIRFGTGEGKGLIKESIRGFDLYILVDPFNWGVTYDVRFNGIVEKRSMMPDEHYMNLKRVISAACGKAKRLSVIMPMLYCGRQHKRHGRESLDSAMALQDICLSMGVDNVITFEAHDPRVQNAIPEKGFENLMTTYQMIKALYYWNAKRQNDFVFDSDHMMIVSPDEGGMSRAVNYSADLGITLGMFYKERDFTQMVDGRNKIIKHEFLGGDVKGKDVIVVDDMIASGGSALDVCRKLKGLGAKRVFFCVAFGLFCNGLAEFDKAYEEGIFDAVFSTNLIYRPDELKKREWFVEVNCSKYLSLLVNTLNHDQTISPVLSHKTKVEKFLVRRGKMKDPATGEYRKPDPATGKFIDPYTNEVYDPDLVFGSELK